jgi:hypothetical protein
VSIAWRLPPLLYRCLSGFASIRKKKTNEHWLLINIQVCSFTLFALLDVQKLQHPLMKEKCALPSA